ncbi:winged helix-turn-helix domain-containing protein [Parvularcula lutaonensis]|uniref:Winged helix-turn-helix domain-containing protein n=1 Tax=Parvularcula lutaonensis TaxID=491923 RepID=A0ABV7MBD1_9PROT|nr:winged helix-turn-helix domain-containing protein [Parvularcula lutaonensis]GGY40295.1 hypothetical protein GCM10007148_05970 [Parvularcula lutaonensis]
MPENARQKLVQIGEFLFDRSRNLLTRGEAEQTLEPKVADLLARFAREPGQTLSRGTLLDDVWGTRIGSDESLTRAVSLLRKAFKADEGATYIETVPKRGYRLVAPVGDAEQAPRVETQPAAKAAEGRSEPGAGEVRQPEHAGPSVFRRSGLSGAVAHVTSSVVYSVAGLAALAIMAIVLVTMVEMAKKRDMMASGGIAVASFTGEASSERSSELAASLAERLPAVLMANTLDVRTDPERAGLLLSGSVDHQGGDIFVVSVQLVSQATGSVLWAAQLKRHDDEGSSIRDDVLGSVGHALGCAIKGFDVYDMNAAFLPIAMRYCSASRDAPGTAAHIEAMNDLLGIASDNASVWAAQAVAQVLWAQQNTGRADRIPEDALDALDNAFSMAIEKDAPAIALAEVMTSAPGALSLSEREEKLRVAALDHGPMRNLARSLLAEQFLSVGRHAEAEALATAIRNTDPAHAGAYRLSVLAETQDGNWERAQAFQEAGERFDPEADWLASSGFDLALYRGDLPTAAALWEEQGAKAFIGVGGSGTACIDLFLETARAKQADDLASVRLDRACIGVDPVTRARLFLALGENVFAAQELTRVGSGTTPDARRALFAPAFDPFRNDERFWGALQRTGLIESYIETGRWPDFCGDRRFTPACEEAARFGS